MTYLTGLFVAHSVLTVLFIQASTQKDVNISNSLTSALVFLSLGMTVTTTFMIGYRIHSILWINGAPSKGLFNHIALIMIELAAAYSLVLCLDVVIAIIPSFNTLGSPLLATKYYVNAALVIVKVSCFW